jgi:hypothetical protein
MVTLRRRARGWKPEPYPGASSDVALTGGLLGQVTGPSYY